MLAYVTKAHETRRAVLFGGMFIAGMIITHVLMGFVTGFGGQWVKDLLRREWGLLLAPLLILLGLMWPGWIKLPLPTIAFRARRSNSGGRVFARYSILDGDIAICPYCTPALIIPGLAT